MTYDEILKLLEECQYAVITERRLVHAGLKEPEFAAIYARYTGLFAQETIHEVKNGLASIPPKERERMERVLFTLLDGNLAARTAELEQDIIMMRQSLSAQVHGDRIGYRELPVRISREPDFAKREELWAAYSALASEITPKRLEREHLTRQGLAAFGFHTTREYAETRKHVSYETLLKKAVPILEETTGLYRRVMSDAVRKTYDMELGDISVAHIGHWRASHEFDQLFTAERLLPNVKTAFMTMGLDLSKLTQIRIDADDRPKKHPRAVTFGAVVPSEVHLLIRPKGGYDDVRAFMHQASRALHFALTSPTLPYEHRQLPRSNALARIFSFTIERLAENPLWLEHVLKLPKAAAERIANKSILVSLFRMRRSIAKLSYELAFDERPFDAARNKALYAKTLHDLTGFAYDGELWMEDADAFFSSADALRAWVASAQLEEHLTRSLGDRWFLKRETGALLEKLFAKGVSWENEDLVQSLGMQPWDPLPLIRTFDPVAKLLR